MQFVPAAWRPTFRWGIPASVSVHAIALALLIFGLPQFAHTPAEPEAIEVELTVPHAPQEPQQATPPEPKPQAREEQVEAPEPAEVVPGQEQAVAPESPAEPEAAAEADQAGQPPVAVLRPVFEFGEEDAGPRQADDGSATREAAPAAEPVAAPSTPEQAIASSETPAPDAEAAPPPSAGPSAPADEDRALHSQNDTEVAAATTAMEALPRGVRAGELCVTELREQLRRSLPPFWPELLPAYRLDEGTILQVRRGAFRAEAQWYELSFRCEIDEAATRVESFTFQVGAAVPRSQWRERGLPSQ